MLHKTNNTFLNRFFKKNANKSDKKSKTRYKMSLTETNIFLDIIIKSVWRSFGPKHIYLNLFSSRQEMCGGFWLFIDLKRGNDSLSHLVTHAHLAPFTFLWWCFPLPICSEHPGMKRDKASQISKECLVVRKPGFSVEKTEMHPWLGYLGNAFCSLCTPITSQLQVILNWDRRFLCGASEGLLQKTYNNSYIKTFCVFFNSQGHCLVSLSTFLATLTLSPSVTM